MPDLSTWVGSVFVFILFGQAARYVFIIGTLDIDNDFIVSYLARGSGYTLRLATFCFSNLFSR